jgi:hypothetical protein
LKKDESHSSIFEAAQSFKIQLSRNDISERVPEGYPADIAA